MSSRTKFPLSGSAVRYGSVRFEYVFWPQKKCPLTPDWYVVFHIRFVNFVSGQLDVVLGPGEAGQRFRDEGGALVFADLDAEVERGAGCLRWPPQGIGNRPFCQCSWEREGEITNLGFDTGFVARLLILYLPKSETSLVEASLDLGSTRNVFLPSSPSGNLEIWLLFYNWLSLKLKLRIFKLYAMSGCRFVVFYGMWSFIRDEKHFP